MHAPLTPCRADRLDQTVATECKGDGDLLQSLSLKNTKTGETSELPVNGLFYAIGECGGVFIPLWHPSRLLRSPGPDMSPESSLTPSPSCSGHEPATQLVKSQLQLDVDGYIQTVPGTAQTSVKGVFAAGDVQDKKYRQAITSAGSGCMAALEAERLISEEEAEDESVATENVHVPAEHYMGADKE